jgi:PEP-CTERM/exosortase A-associated glycosyltransferase
MRVLHVLDHSIPLQSGYTFRTRAILREQRRLGWETFHLTGPKHAASGVLEEEVDGLRFCRTPWTPGPFSRLPVLHEIAQMRATATRLDQLVRLIKPDVLHAHSPVLNAVPALWVGRKHSIPVIYEVRAFWEDAAVDHGTSKEWGLRYRATRALETFALKRADHVTTICEGLRQEIVGRGVPAEKVTVIPNAVDVAMFRFAAKPDEALKQQLGLTGMTVLGFIGSFYAYEGLDLLIEALLRVLAARPDVRVLLVGGGPQEGPLRALAEQRGLRTRVLFTGRVPHAEVQRYYSIVDVLVYPRRSMRLTELVTPLKPLEAMAQGQLLVASDVGGHRELIRDGVNGFLCAPGSADALAEKVLDVLARRDTWTEVKALGRRFVETERNWRSSVRRYRRVYDLALGGTSG